ncbi:MAG: methyltransferase [Peptococcaceae bacterium]|jgi:16S rRNA (guanine(966)-N(2))-methyltransferase RsmD|nr:methyltransferase [Peptococcaceae bacterium]
MRIIAGEAKGHTLKCLKGLTTRPTLDRVREAIFNVLGAKTIDAVVLDLFAGTGALGIEALSRGSKFCLFNDINKKACSIIKENLMHCRLAEKARVFNLNAGSLLGMLEEEPAFSLDIIFLDPPYDKGLYEPVLSKLGISALLKTNTAVVVESDRNTPLEKSYGKLELVKKSSYGDTLVWYYQPN